MGTSLAVVLVKLILLTALLEAAARIAAAQSKPGCLSQCGDISIPYPFGTGNDCNITEEFFITCNTTSIPNKAFLTDSNIEVVNISLDGQLRVLSLASYDCYNSSGRSYYFNYWLQLSKFPVNNTRNKFTAIGCDTFAVVEFPSGEYATGCLSLCNDVGDVINGSCSGIGCCQTSIPKGVSGYNINLYSPDNHTQVLADNPCSYAFVAEDTAHNFSNSDLGGYDLLEKQFPVILDWTIGHDTSCSEAKKDIDNFACTENSNCVDSEISSGSYICKCFEGFEGNPYLSNGCQGNHNKFP